MAWRVSRWWSQVSVAWKWVTVTEEVTPSCHGDTGRRRVQTFSHLFLLFCRLLSSWLGFLFPALGLHRAGGLVVIIFSHVSNRRQEIISAWCYIVFVLMGCWECRCGTFTGNVFGRENGGIHKNNLQQSSITKSLGAWNTFVLESRGFFGGAQRMKMSLLHLLQHFNLEEDVFTVTSQIAIKFDIDLHSLRRICSTKFVDPLKFPIAPPRG